MAIWVASMVILTGFEGFSPDFGVLMLLIENPACG